MLNIHNPKGRDFEEFSNSSIYDNGWKANAQYTLPWRQDLAPANWEKDRGELHHLEENLSEANDLAAAMPGKLAEIKKKFEQAAVKHHVYPFDDRGAGRLSMSKPLVSGAVERSKTFNFFAGATRI